VIPDSDYTIIDLTLPLAESTPIYHGDPELRKSWHTVDEETGCRVGKLELGLHCGTHVDAPLHVLNGGQGIGEMALSLFCGNAVVVDARKAEGQNIEASDIERVDIMPGDIVLFRTGWEERANTPRFFSGEWPGFAEGAVQLLHRKRVKSIGGDMPSADSPSGIRTGLRSHKCALKAGMPIFEALFNLHTIVGKRVIFIALPLRIVEGDASPVRAVAIVARENNIRHPA
jgi:kynurenine formamidase